ncbi:major facilitator superfamily protein [Diplodia corticola]|uniref:Major facilitator superfamily protein n=1 Tax=Diplodia corticola TaxID=236234 RepID=A0A1J9SGN2_9PEZI|nr:major facilitator superfamily protein [Diplodia corticola]OJD38741.1 major facilitator superfamily protein [Diplodia corticola]
MSAEKPEFLEGENIFPSDRSSGEVALEPAWTEEEERAVRRKMDWHLVPLVTLLYLLCFLDRSNIGNARIQGLAKDLQLVGYQFNWSLTVFYITYMLVEVPSNIVLKKIGPRWWLPFLVAGFGLVSLCTAFVHNFSQLMVARAFLGLFEGGTMPGIAFYLSCFYRRQELLFRIGIFVSAASMAGAFGGLLATGLSRIPEWGVAATPMHTWRNIFFFEGLATLLIGGASPWLMATKPEECTFLTERERYIAAERLALDQHKGIAVNERVTAQHVRRAVLNINNNVCALGFFLINITVQSISLFMPTLLADLGWTATKAQLHTVPPYVLACVVAIAVAFASDRTRHRGIWLALFAPVGIVGFAVLRADGPSPNIKYMAVFFVTIGVFPGGPAFLSWGLNNAAGPAIRAVASGYIVSVGTLGAVVATWTYLPSDAPRYPIGHSINLGAQAAAFFLALAGMAYVVWENGQRERGRRDHRVEGKSEEEVAALGYRHPGFRYIP